MNTDMSSELLVHNGTVGVSSIKKECDVLCVKKPSQDGESRNPVEGFACRCSEDYERFILPPESYTVLNLDALWPRIVPVLREPKVLSALNAGMEYWCQVENRGCVNFIWTPDHGPWVYSRPTDHWPEEIDERFNRAGGDTLVEIWARREGRPSWKDDPDGAEAWLEEHQGEWFDEEERVKETLSPQPNTPDWYRCYQSCHCLAAWNCEVGQAVFPGLDWRVVLGNRHSCAFGIAGESVLIVDILWGHSHTVKQILRAIGKRPVLYTLDEAIARLEQERLLQLSHPPFDYAFPARVPH